MAEQHHVAQIITHLARGGAQATVLAALSDDDGIRHTVITGPDDPGEGTFWSDERLQSADVELFEHLHRRPHPIHDLRVLLRLVRWLHIERPDVLHTHSSKPGVLGRIAAALTRTPVVHTVHGWSFAPLRGRPRAVVIRLERMLARLSDTLVVVATEDRATGLEAGIGTAEQYRLIRSGIDLGASVRAAGHRPEMRTRLGLDPDVHVIGCVARMSAQKRLHDCVAAFAEADLDGAHLCLIGDGPLRSEVLDQIRDLGLDDRVTLSGARSDANEVVAALDLFVLTSGWEGLPRTVIEAMAAGVPVAATPVGGIPEVIEDGRTGRLFDVGDVSALAEIMRWSSAEARARSLLAARASRQAADFDQATMRSALHEVWSVPDGDRDRRAEKAA